MINRRFLLALCAAAAVGLVAWTSPREDHHSDTVTVFAAASLTDALTEASHAFEAANDCTVRLSFAASSTLARQVVAGAGPDVFISAHPRWMDYLEEAGALAPGTRRDLYSNRVVGIAPATGTGEQDGGEQDDLAQWLRTTPGRVAMGDPAHVPAGIYGRQALESLGLWEDVAPRLAPCANTRAALLAVGLGECRAGIVYATDAAASPGVRVVARFPESGHRPIRYPAACLAPRKAVAEEFLAFLQSGPGRAAVTRHGFTVLGERVAPATTVGTVWSPWLTAPERRAARLSLWVALASVLALLAPGILTGWLLARRDFPGKGFLEAATNLPIVVPPVVTGYLLLLLLGRQGWVGALLEEWFGLRLAFTLWAAVIASAVMAFPLMVRSVRVAIEMVDPRLEEAAAVFGAGPLRRFTTITLPLAAPGIMAGTVLSFSRSLGEFGATMTFAGSIPGETQTVPLAIFAALQQPGEVHSVTRLALISLGIALAAVWASRRLERGALHGRRPDNR